MAVEIANETKAEQVVTLDSSGNRITPAKDSSVDDVETLLASILAKQSSDPATQTTLEAILAAVNNLVSALGELVTVTVAGPTALTAADTRKVYSNEGAVAQVGVTLPAAAAGLVFSFVVQDANGVRITAAAGDTIRVGEDVSIAAGYVESTAVGSTITLIAINATEWFAAPSPVGTWTVEVS